MEYKYYKSWAFLNDLFEISENSLSSIESFYRFYYEQEIKSKVGQRNVNGKFDHVFYTGNNPEDIKEYHLRVFGKESSFIIIQELGARAFFLKGYKNDLFTGAEMYNFNEKYLEVRHAIYNSDYELQQFTESFYDENGRLVKEKVFMPSIWQIHVENYDN